MLPAAAVIRPASFRGLPLASGPPSCQCPGKTMRLTGRERDGPMRVISEKSTRITKATIDAAWRRRAPELRVILRDKDCRGLALIVNPTAMAWTYAYRPRGAD